MAATISLYVSGLSQAPFRAVPAHIPANKVGLWFPLVPPSSHVHDGAPTQPRGKENIQRTQFHAGCAELSGGILRFEVTLTSTSGDCKVSKAGACKVVWSSPNFSKLGVLSAHKLMINYDVQAMQSTCRGFVCPNNAPLYIHAEFLVLLAAA
ncbi:MAG: hypothetical protein BJ554DRAFT_4171, partial [Olpidium bornovanus]